MARVRARIVVSGEVQGVGFRYATVREARRLGLIGWVRNTRDGKVEILAEGEAGHLDELAVWCHAGPPGARVDAVHRSAAPDAGPLTDFQVRF